MKSNNPKKRLLTDNQIQEAYNLYTNSNQTADEVAEQYNVKTRTLRKYFTLIRKEGVIPTTRQYNAPELSPKIINDYEQKGVSIRQLSFKYDIPYSTLYRRLNKS